MKNSITNKELNILRGRFMELAHKSEKTGTYTYTDFLGLLEQNLYSSLERELLPYHPLAFGGIEDAERIVLRFGDASLSGYEEPFPICSLLITPFSPKFKENLTHRDVLGALMGLGIERSMLGDIYINEDKILLFCLTKIKDFLKESLSAIRHTEVNISELVDDYREFTDNYEIIDIQIPSERLDAVISKVFHLSRDKSQSLIKQGKLFINGKNILSVSGTPKVDDKITLRGFGRIKYIGPLKTTKKGNLLVRIHKNN